MVSEHPAVAFLLAAHQQVEEMAQAAGGADGWWVISPRYSDPRFVGGKPPVPDDFEILGMQSGPVVYVVVEEAAAAERAMREAMLIQANNPATVLRRVAAERKQLAEHQPTREARWRGPESWDPCELPGCPCAGVAENSPEADLIAGCGTCASGHAYDAVVEHWPCRTVLLLAKAWGWEEAS